MTTRRELLKIGLAVSPLLAGTRAGAALSSSTGSVSIYKVIYDTRFAASLAFGRRAVAGGLTVAALDGDMTRLWYDDLYHRWKHGPAAIAGLTAHGALFCLERLAWDQGMRVVYCGEHAAAADGVAHRLEGPAELVTAAARAMSRESWPGALADVVAACPRVRQVRESATALTRGRTLQTPEPLFSWVIAPRCEHKI